MMAMLLMLPENPWAQPCELGERGWQARQRLRFTVLSHRRRITGVHRFSLSLDLDHQHSLGRGAVALGRHYVASEGGIPSLTRAMALELARYRIRFNAIAPGLTDTARSARRSTCAISQRRLSDAWSPGRPR